nr:hypothetical protein [Nitrososphaerota archaeon]
SAASKMLSEFIGRLRNGLVPVASLTFEKKLGKDPGMYSVNAPQKIAAELSGLRAGDVAKYIISKKGVAVSYDAVYDWVKYALMAISAAGTVLEPLGLTPSLETTMQHFY